MTAEQLRNSILQEAISGRLVPQDPNDEPASVLLTNISICRDKLVKEKKVKAKDITSDPITEDEIPFKLPAKWEFVRLNYVAIIARGGSPRPIKEYLTDSPEGLNWIKIGDTEKGGKYINQTKERIKPEGLKKSRLIHKGDFLLTNSMSFGRPYISNIEGCIHDGWLVISPAFGNAFDKDFLYYLLSSPFAKDQFAGKVSGAVVQNLNSEKVATSILPLPPLAEQQRIAAKLEELLPIVEQYGKAQKELDELNAALPARLRQSILQEAISGKLVPQDENDEPASVLLGHIQTEKQRLVKEKILKAKDIVVTPIPEDELPFDIPETWSWCRLGELAFERMGKTPPRGESEYWLNAKYPWVSISDMKDYGHVKTTKEGVSEIAAQKAFRQISPIGSLLMSFKLTVGRTAILDIDAYHNEAIITIQPYVDKEYAFRNYLFYVLPLLANLGDSKDAIKGKTLNSTSLFNLYIPLPPLAEQQRIVAKIEELFAEIDKLK